MTLATDGSAQADAPETVEIDLTDPNDRWRYRCPNEHTSWEPTNSHYWCHSCSRYPDADPEHYEIVGVKTGEKIPWSAVEVVK